MMLATRIKFQNIYNRQWKLYARLLAKLSPHLSNYFFQILFELTGLHPSDIPEEPH